MVSTVTSGVTPAGSGTEELLRRFVGVTPAGTVVCACAGVVISIREAIERITAIVAVVFAVFLGNFIFPFSFSLFAKRALVAIIDVSLVLSVESFNCFYSPFVSAWVRIVS